MDYSLLVQPVINSLWYFLPILVFILFIKSPWFKGKVGEGMLYWFFDLVRGWVSPQAVIGR